MTSVLYLLIHSLAILKVQVTKEDTIWMVSLLEARRHQSILGIEVAR
jgi:hypothetical protein